MELKKELNKMKVFIEEELKNVLPEKKLYGEKIFKSMRYSVLAGGKRLRPILNIKACELVGGNIKDTMVYALAIELIHTYSLIHDDLPSMDNDNYRRGKLTNHKVFGNDIAILAGDGLLNYAYELMISNIRNNDKKSNKYIYAMDEIAKASGVYGMVGGQVVDIISENKEISKDELEYIHLHKTAALINASIVSGAIIGGASKNELEALKGYGKCIGLGFQIRDDILDKIGDIEKIGKDIGSDESNSKVTYLTFHGLEESIKKTEELCKKAITYLSIFDNKRSNFFKDLAQYLVYREK